MNVSTKGDLGTRDGFISAIQRAGRYIEEHAENLLGEYPSLLSELDITARFRFDSVPTVEVRREHIACDSYQYPHNSAAADATGVAQ